MTSGDPTSSDPGAANTGVLDDARSWLQAARSVLVLTGAGISTDSGIPDFRGPNGVWTRNPAAERASHIDVYVSEPEVRRAAWAARLDHPANGAEPNDGHVALLRLERAGKLTGLVTQNIDGLHLTAGHDPTLVLEVHGNAREVRCLDCDDRAPMEVALDRVRAGEEDPPCRSCGGMLKSATVSFGQSLDSELLTRAQALAASCDVLLCVGSTLTVFPVAELPHVATGAGARVIVVNGAETAFDDRADAVLTGSISGILDAVVPSPA